MRQEHPAGDKVFVDYSGKKIGIVDPQTGVVQEAEIFVAVLGASSFTYAEASWTQALPDWIGAHVRMFRFFGGVPRLIVPDNLKSGVNKASFYDPEINRSYGMMAAHYGVGIVPARPYKPRDKAKVEANQAIAGMVEHMPDATVAGPLIGAGPEWGIMPMFLFSYLQHRGDHVSPAHLRKYE
jgi:transposase